MGWHSNTRRCDSLAWQRQFGRIPGFAAIPFGFALIGLSGCAGLVDAVSGPAPAVPTVAPTPIIRVTPSPDVATPAPSEAYPPSDDAFECVAPVPAVMDWLRDLGTGTGDRPSDLSADDVVMVQVGPGNNPAELWYIVALPDANQFVDRRNERVFLTNVPSPQQPSGETWLNVSHHINARAGRDGWEHVRWPAERIEFGRRAEAFALACLAQTN